LFWRVKDAFGIFQEVWNALRSGGGSVLVIVGVATADWLFIAYLASVVQ
jgi:hypothetical protein